MATPKPTLSGVKFGRLRAIASPYEKKGTLFVNMICSCGIEKIISVDKLLSGQVKSCGCLTREVSELLRNTDLEGRLKTSARREYTAFSSAIQRCTNPKAHAFDACGGACIRFHEPWLGDFPAFFSDMGPAKPGQILLRKDTHADYSPWNCVWGTWGDFGTIMKARRSVRPISIVA